METPARLVYRPALTRVLAACYAALAAWWVVALLLGAGPLVAARDGAWLVAIGVAVYALFWRPSVIVDADGVVLVNVVRTVRVPWRALESLDTRFALTVHAGGRRYASWAASAPGRTGSAVMSVAGRTRHSRHPHVLPDPRWIPGEVPDTRVSRDLRSDSGAAAFMVEQAWRGWRDRAAGAGDAQAPGDAQTPEVASIAWSIPLLAVAGAAVLCALLLGRIG